MKTAAMTKVEGYAKYQFILDGAIIKYGDLKRLIKKGEVEGQVPLIIDNELICKYDYSV